MKFDLNNRNQQLIIAGMAGLIDEGYTFHEMVEILEAVKQQTFPALIELSQEVANKK